MVGFIASYILVFLAAILNAVMDTIADEPHFNKSIFKNWDKRFWSKEISWSFSKKIFNWKFDGWHVAKSLMIICLVGAIITFRVYHQWWVHFISFGVIWNVTFEFFYSKIFKAK